MATHPWLGKVGKDTKFSLDTFLETTLIIQNWIKNLHIPNIYKNLLRILNLYKFLKYSNFVVKIVYKSTWGGLEICMPKFIKVSFWKVKLDVYIFLQFWQKKYVRISKFTSFFLHLIYQVSNFFYFLPKLMKIALLH